jgi:hypothetical protein
LYVSRLYSNVTTDTAPLLTASASYLGEVDPNTATRLLLKSIDASACNGGPPTKSPYKLQKKADPNNRLQSQALLFPCEAKVPVDSSIVDTPKSFHQFGVDQTRNASLQHEQGHPQLRG